MKRFDWAVLAMVGSLLVGCSASSSPSVTITDSNGDKVTMNEGGANVTMADGSKSSMTTSTKNGETNLTVTDQNGDKTTMTQQKDGSVKMTGKDGTASVGGGTSISEAELGVPFYPGSTENTAENLKFENNGQTTYSSSRETSDPVEKVGEFYKGKVKGLETVGSSEGLSGSAKLASGGQMTLTAFKKDGKTVINITTTSKK